MKKFILAAFLVALFASCWHSEERAVNDQLSTYTVQESQYVGLKKTGAPAGDNLTEPLYLQVEEINGVLLAQCKKDPDGNSRWAILNSSTAQPITNLRFEKVWIGDGYFTMQAKDDKYFFANYELYGPKSDIAYYFHKNKLFTKSDGKWGCEGSIKEEYSRLLYITDGTEGRFIGIDGKKATLLDRSGNVLKKNIPVAQVTKLEQSGGKKVWTYHEEVSVFLVKSTKSAI